MVLKEVLHIIHPSHQLLGFVLRQPIGPVRTNLQGGPALCTLLVPLFGNCTFGRFRLCSDAKHRIEREMPWLYAMKTFRNI